MFTISSIPSDGISDKTTERLFLKVTAADRFILLFNGTLSPMAENPLKTLIWERVYKIVISCTHAYLYPAEDTDQGKTSIFSIAIHFAVEEACVNAINFSIQM